MRALENALEKVRTSGLPEVVTVIGAGGVGKTRLVRDFLQKLRGQRDKSPRVFRGNAREADAHFGIFARVLRARFGLVEGMDAEAAKAQIRTQVAAALDDRKVGDVVYFLGQLLELQFLDSPMTKAVEGDGEQLRSLRRAVVKHFFEADAGVGVKVSPDAPPRSPVVLVFDDVHFAQEDSLELLQYLCHHLRAPILILVIARPELVARRDDWLEGPKGRHFSIQLGPLSDDDAAIVMSDLLQPCGKDEAVDDLIDAACTLAGGNAGLLEQMLRIFFDIGVIEDDQSEASAEERWLIHADKLSSVRLPMTVEEAVSARISSLSPEERDLLERAATMGGVFWLGGLLATLRISSKVPDIWNWEDAEDARRVRATMRDLTERDYVLRLPDSTFPGDEEYAFKHNLERETLFRLVAPQQRKRFHAAIADWLAYKDHVRTHEEYVAMLARHREQSGARAQAAIAYLEAAHVARSHYANEAAAPYYERGLKLIEEDGVEVDPERHIRALHHYGDVLQSLGKNDAAMAVFKRMLARAYKIDQRTKGGAAHGRIGRLYREVGELDKAARHLDAAHRLFEGGGDERGVASTIDDIGKVHWLRGDYPKALEATERALAMRRRMGDRRSIALSLNNLGLVYQDSGQFKEALNAFEQALLIRREIGDLVGVCVSLNNLGTVAQDQRDDGRALVLFQEGLEVARETGDRSRIALVLTNLGETLTRLARAEDAVKSLKEAEAIVEDLGDKIGLGEASRALSKAYLARGETAQAKSSALRAVQTFRDVDSKVQLGVALRTLGEVAAASTASAEGLDEAREHIAEAAHIFQTIGNEVELARSHRSLAEILRSLARTAGDHTLLQEAASHAEKADAVFARMHSSVPRTT